jgi:antirestriction protein ArdC
MNDRADIYQKITDQIADSIEKGAGRFEMPWHANSGMPANAATGKFYRGVNPLVLFATVQEKGYSSPLWATYKQWGEKEAQVRKGEKAAIVVFWKFFDRPGAEETEAEPDERSGRRAMARSYPVFNAEQVDGFTPPIAPALPHAERIAHADEFYRNTGAVIRHGGARAFYRPGTDEIHMPEFQAFKSPEGYYSTLGHEATHWSGAPHRLGRKIANRFGSEDYAYEELIAELSAAYQMAALGLSNEPRQEHAAYIQSWLKGLKNDKRFIFSAASQAQQAADYLHELQYKQPKAPDAVLRAMEDEPGPLPDAVAAAWADDFEKPSFAEREERRRAKRTGKGVA